MATAYVTFCKALVKAEDGHAQGPIELSSYKLTVTGTAVQTVAAPDKTTFAVLTMRDADGVFKVGTNPTAVDGDRFTPDRVPTVVHCVENQKISILNLV